MIRGRIIGTGRCLPDRVVTNDDLAAIVDTSDEWISSRTGIRSRRIAGAGEFTSKLASGAARQAMAMAGVAATELDLIVVATISSEIAMPSCACLVQMELGAARAFAYDINAACCGFTYALDIADKYVRANPAMKVLVIGAETLSSRTNWEDRNTCVLFGDGAGAAVVTGDESGRGLVHSRLFSDGNLWNLLYMEGAPSLNRELVHGDGCGSYIRMNGREIFKYAVRAMGDVVTQVLEESSTAIEEVRLVIPHQANIRIIQSLMERAGIPPEKIYLNIDKYGNTSAASIPIALDEVNRAGMLASGDLVLLCTFGAGLTWAASLLRW
ncbi:MAG: beta-ketoacyl-ACP synthase III [Thermodesulfobacteriota bacterium]